VEVSLDLELAMECHTDTHSHLPPPFATLRNEKRELGNAPTTKLYMLFFLPAFRDLREHDYY